MSKKKTETPTAQAEVSAIEPAQTTAANVAADSAAETAAEPVNITAEALAAETNFSHNNPDEKADNFFSQITGGAFEDEAAEPADAKEEKKKRADLSTKRKATSFVNFIDFAQKKILKAISQNANADFSFTTDEKTELSEFAEAFADDINISPVVWFLVAFAAIETDKVILAAKMRKNAKNNTEEKSEEKTAQNLTPHEKKEGRGRFKVDEKLFFEYNEQGRYLKKTDRTQRPTLAEMAATIQANPAHREALKNYFATL